jgi:hypothetical protein
MINLTANITFPNVNRWQVLAFDLGTGLVTLRFWAPANTLPTPPWIDIACRLSDTANASTGADVNPAPSGWNDKFMSKGPSPGVAGMGAINSFTNAINAYRAAPNHNAGLRAIEGQAMTDGWVGSALAGS